jgi:hypothetical protein
VDKQYKQINMETLQDPYNYINIVIINIMYTSYIAQYFSRYFLQIYIFEQEIKYLITQS